MTKKELRTVIAARKKEYGIDVKRQKSNHIIEKLVNTEEFQKAQSVLCYWSMPDEVFTHDFVAKLAQDKRFFLPVVSGDVLLIREFAGVENLTEGTSFSILEPVSNIKEVSIEDIDLVVVPGVAFDLNGGRLGRGKGFYDKLLAHATAYKIGVCFDFQLVDKVPRGEYDILMDNIIFA